MTEQEYYEVNNAMLKLSQLYLETKLQNIFLNTEIQKLLKQNAEQKAHIINLTKQDLIFRAN